MNHADVLDSQITGGPDGHDVLVGTFRLAKWYDTFGANGKPEALYQPLSNAKFKLYITTTDGQEVELADMASGKEANNDYALAVSGAFQLVPADYSSASGVGTLTDYEHEGDARSYSVN